jgi:hypothetical protein
MAVEPKHAHYKDVSCCVYADSYKRGDGEKRRG